MYMTLGALSARLSHNVLSLSDHGLASIACAPFKIPVPTPACLPVPGPASAPPASAIPLLTMCMTLAAIPVHLIIVPGSVSLSVPVPPGPTSLQVPESLWRPLSLPAVTLCPGRLWCRYLRLLAAGWMQEVHLHKSHTRYESNSAG